MKKGERDERGATERKWGARRGEEGERSGEGQRRKGTEG
jgi:hypothetical protein